MKIVTTPAADAFIAERGGRVWVWLDPRRGLVGLLRLAGGALRAAGQQPARPSSPGARNVRTGSRCTPGAGVEVHYDFGRLELPDEVHFDVKGFRNKTKRLEAYWNGCVFAGPDVPAPADRPS